MGATPERELISVAGRELSISNPRKVLFPEAGVTKLDLVRYYLAVADGALRGAGGRPNVLVRYPNGIGEEFFYQKRAPASRPEWIEVVALQFPSGRTAEEVVPRDAAALAWMANLACLELHPHPVLAEDLDHPNELRVDLDPMPGVEWRQIQEVAAVAREVLGDHGLTGWPKTSGSRGIHINVRIEPRWTFVEVRRSTSRASARAARAGARYQQVVEGGAPRRVHRLQPERQGPHGVRGLLGAAASRCPCLGAAYLGRDRRVRSGGLHADDHAGPLRGPRRPPRRHRRAPRLARGAAGVVRAAGVRRPRRRPVAPAVRQDAW
jgi:DNA ligase D-like protein (predicted polymerase)